MKLLDGIKRYIKGFDIVSHPLNRLLDLRNSENETTKTEPLVIMLQQYSFDIYERLQDFIMKCSSDIQKFDMKEETNC